MLYKEIVKLYEKLQSTSSRIEKTFHISELLSKTSADEVGIVITLIKGSVFPEWEEKKLGVATRLIVKALQVSFGNSEEQVEREWKKTGDLGTTAEKLAGKKKQATLSAQALTAQKVLKNIRQLAELEGAGSVDMKVKLIAQLLTSAEPLEAKYVTRTVLEELRVGAGEGSIRDAILWAYLPKIFPIFCKCTCDAIVPAQDYCLNCGREINEFVKSKELISFKDEKEAREAYNQSQDAVQRSIDLTADIALVAEVLRREGLDGLKKISLSPTKPVKVMLYQKATGIEDAFNTVGKPAALEYKYDGFRLTLHKKGEAIRLFTRRLEDVSNQFPEIVKLATNNIRAQDFILDSEVIGYDPKTKKWLPFQDISQRIRRKYDIQKMQEDVPVIVNIFDVLEVDGKSMLEQPFSKRRDILKKIVAEEKNKIQLAEQIVTSSLSEAEKFYKKALSLGNEGIMVKNMDAPYQPGSRVGYGVKVKPTMETLDLVVVGATWGEGKRSKWLSSYTLGCRDGKEFLELGKVGTGFKEKSEGLSFEELTEEVRKHIVSEKAKEVIIKPVVVIEVVYEEIQRSPTYSSGFALRFPRVVRLRRDKPASEASTLQQVNELFLGQR